MQQGRDDERVGRPLGLGERGALERVPRLRDGLAEVGGVPLAVKQTGDLVKGVHEVPAPRLASWPTRHWSRIKSNATRHDPQATHESRWNTPVQP